LPLAKGRPADARRHNLYPPPTRHARTSAGIVRRIIEQNRAPRRRAALLTPQPTQQVAEPGLGALHRQESARQVDRPPAALQAQPPFGEVEKT
jgi:hypothetical protein